MTTKQQTTQDKTNKIPPSAQSFLDTLRAALTGRHELQHVAGAMLAQWALLRYKSEETRLPLKLIGVISAYNLHQWNDKSSYIDAGRHKWGEWIEFAPKTTSMNASNALTSELLRQLNSVGPEESIVREGVLLGLRSEGCYLAYEVKGEEFSTQLSLTETITHCSNTRVAVEISAMLAEYPVPEKGYIPPLRRFLSNLLQVIEQARSEQAAEKSANAIPLPTPEVEKPAYIRETIPVPEAGSKPPVEEFIHRYSGEYAAANPIDLYSDVSKSAELPTVEQGEASIQDQLRRWEQLSEEGTEADLARRELVKELSLRLRSRTAAAEVGLLEYLNDAKGAATKTRVALAAELIDSLPLASLLELLPRLSPRLLVECAARQPGGSLPQMAADALERKRHQAAHGRDTFADVRPLLEALRDLTASAMPADRDLLRWRLFHALSETCARARSLAHMNDSQGGADFLYWMRHTLLPSLPLEERFRWGLQMAQNVLQLDSGSTAEENDPLYPLLRDLLVERQADVALREMLALPTVHREAFWRFLVKRSSS